jgi:Xaa-Pro aminopeptidase
MVNYLKRISKLKKELENKNIDYLIIGNLDNIFYLSGFTGSNALFVINKNDEHIFITDSRYIEQSAQEVGAGIRIEICKGNLYAGLVGILNQNKQAGIIGIESKNIYVSEYEFIKEKLLGFKFIQTQNLVENIRIIKEPVEIKNIKKAINIAEKSFLNTLEFIKIGEKEKSIANKLEYEMENNGAEGTAFNTIIASGQRSIMPHASASFKQLESGDPVLMDFGCKVNGYNSDLTRTLFLGKISRKLKDIYENVKNTQETVINSIKSGEIAGKLDLLARNSLLENKLDEYFLHTLGHGIGINVHEYPNISSTSEVVLQENMVFTIEPGVYIKGLGGIRIEDVVLVTNTGCEVLSTLTKELIVI